ncbi:GlsB/YeaQ/YmgE family stress response membrane protein [Geodermatophilus sp. SYSU D00758]
MIWNIVVLLVIGLVAGLIARAVIPGKQDLSIVATIGLGVVGSFVGNLLGGLLSGRGFELAPAGWIGSIVGAIIVLGVYVSVTGRRGTRTR